MRLFTLVLAFAALGLADTVVMRDGRVIHGNYLGGSPRQVKLEVGDQIQTLDISDISRIEFAGAAPVTSAVQPPQRPRFDSPPPPPPVSAQPPAPPPPPAPPAAPAYTAGIQLPAGTNFVIRMIDGVDSEVNRVGQSFAASLDEPVVINGQTVILRGADVVVKLVDAQESGKLTGRAELTLDLMSVRVNGNMVDINTETVSRESSSRGARTAKVAGGTAALGAIIGAIAGGGKGAAIGVGAGAAAGAGAEVVTKGQRVKIPSETRLTFVLNTPVQF
ncbi:MAG: hypothetical protein JO323_15080 [Acidobacteriia bacterium]|nr:hypothetical protein [Terriglobia bacterium]